MSLPLAYLLTWRSYGTWLPGDERGTVNPLHNKFGTPYAPPDEGRYAISEAAMTGPPFVLNTDARALVDATVRAHCGIKKWGLKAVNVRTNHVHAVVSCGSFDPDLAIGQFKSWTKRELRASRIAGEDQEVWARRGSTHYLWTDQDVADAVHYVLNCQ